MKNQRSFAEEYVEFLQLFAEYEFALDEGDPDKIANCFTRDGLWGGGFHGELKGRDAIRESMRRRKEKLDAIHPGKPVYEFRRHHMSNPELVLEGDRGKFRAYFLNTVRHGDRIEIGATGHYYGTVVKEDGRWRFLERYCMPDTREAGWWPPTEYE